MDRTAVAALALLAGVACRGEPAIERVPPDAYKGPTTVASETPTPTASGPALRSGPPSATCVKGWGEPSEGPFRTIPLNLIRASQRLGEVKVDDLRYFTDERGDLRWYGKVTSGSFRVRFLVGRDADGERIVAVAPHATTGFRSPDWKGFEGRGGSVAIEGVPGRWPGEPFDFVNERGLPATVAGCLDG